MTISMSDKEKIAELEKRIEQLSADTSIVKYYISMKKQVDSISALMATMRIDEDSLSDKDDKFFDRYKFFVEKSLLIVENLQKMEQLIAPIMKKKEAAGTAEEYAEFNEDKENGT